LIHSSLGLAELIGDFSLEGTDVLEFLRRADDRFQIEAPLAELMNLGKQRLVDIQVEHVSIVGHNVKIVEQVTGRMTNGRAAGYGAATGAWFGLLIGLLFGLLAPTPTWLWLLLWSLVLGAVRARFSVSSGTGSRAGSVTSSRRRSSRPSAGT